MKILLIIICILLSLLIMIYLRNSDREIFDKYLSPIFKKEVGIPLIYMIFIISILSTLPKIEFLYYDKKNLKIVISYVIIVYFLEKFNSKIKLNIFIFIAIICFVNLDNYSGIVGINYLRTNELLMILGLLVVALIYNLFLILKIKINSIENKISCAMLICVLGLVILNEYKEEKYYSNSYSISEREIKKKREISLSKISLYNKDERLYTNRFKLGYSGKIEVGKFNMEFSQKYKNGKFQENEFSYLPRIIKEKSIPFLLEKSKKNQSYDIEKIYEKEVRKNKNIIEDLEKTKINLETKKGYYIYNKKYFIIKTDYDSLNRNYLREKEFIKILKRVKEKNERYANYEDYMSETKKELSENISKFMGIKTLFEKKEIHNQVTKLAIQNLSEEKIVKKITGYRYDIYINYIEGNFDEIQQKFINDVTSKYHIDDYDKLVRIFFKAKNTDEFIKQIDVTFKRTEEYQGKIDTYNTLIAELPFSSERLIEVDNNGNISLSMKMKIKYGYSRWLDVEPAKVKEIVDKEFLLPVIEMTKNNKIQQFLLNSILEHGLEYTKEMFKESNGKLETMFDIRMNKYNEVVSETANTMNSEYFFEKQAQLEDLRDRLKYPIPNDILGQIPNQIIKER